MKKIFTIELEYTGKAVRPVRTVKAYPHIWNNNLFFIYSIVPVGGIFYSKSLPVPYRFLTGVKILTGLVRKPVRFVRQYRQKLLSIIGTIPPQVVHVYAKF
jgi:hypothetical protein